MKVECLIRDSRVQLLFDEKMVVVKGSYDSNSILINYGDLVHNEFLNLDEVNAVMDAVKTYNKTNDVHICIVDY